MYRYLTQWILFGAIHSCENDYGGERQSVCLFKCCKTSFPTADMSAPESGRTSNSLEPLAEEVHTSTNGDRSVIILWMLEMLRCRTVGVFSGACVGVRLCLRILLQHTLEKGQLFGNGRMSGYRWHIESIQLGEP